MKHINLIRALIAEIRSLREQLEESNCIIDSMQADSERENRRWKAERASVLQDIADAQFRADEAEAKARRACQPTPRKWF